MHNQRTCIQCVNGVICIQCSDYRLMTAYLLLLVNCDKVMHARQDFDVSNAHTRRVSTLDKHQNRTKAYYFVTVIEHKVNTQSLILIHTKHKLKSSFFLGGYCTPYLKLACFVCFLKIINTFLKNP